MGAETPHGLRIVRVGTLNKHGRAGWPQVMALQFAVRLTRLRRDLEQVEELCEPDSWKSLAEAAWESEGWREAAREYHADRKRRS